MGESASESLCAETFCASRTTTQRYRIQEQTVTMAATAFLPRLASPLTLAVSRWATFHTTPYTLKFLPSLSIAIPGVTINIPGLLGDIWESVLRAVPKNKVSHSKKRSRQMAGKALKDVNHLCKCPGCGEIKRTHRLCQHCLEGMATGSGCALRYNANFFSFQK